MIRRYEEEQISQIWSENSKFNHYLDVELALLKALEKHQLIEAGSYEQFSKVKINEQRIHEIEAVVKHDIIAFCTSITEQVNDGRNRFFHYGVTSSDILDTATSLQIKKSLHEVLTQLVETKKEIFILASNTKNLITVGRSHGMYAEVMSFGQKILGHYAEFARREKELQRFYEEEITGQLSGAVGNYTVITPEIEKEAIESLGLKVEPLSTQVIPRDRFATLVSLLANMAGAIERLAVEIRHLHRSEVGEVSEGFTKGQKGSSTMPHKKNPIAGENLTGIARMIRSNIIVALENNILWHERDISHSSAERLYLPDVFGLSFYALKRLKNTLKNLVVHEQTITERADSASDTLSSYYLHQMISTTDLKREDIYPIIQEAAFKSREEGLEFNVALKSHLDDKNIKVDIEWKNTLDMKEHYINICSEKFEAVLSNYPL